MRNLQILTAWLLGVFGAAACTIESDVARSDGSGSGGTSSSEGTGGLNSSGGSGETTGGTAGASNADVAIERSDLPAITTPDINDADYAAFIGDTNGFGLELGQRLAERDGTAANNGVFSPVSVSLALGMTYAGAAGDTLAAMKATLRDNLASGRYHVAHNRLLRDLGSRAYSGTDGMGNALRLELSPANSVWAERTVVLGKPFLDVLGQQYDSGVMRVSFLDQAEAARLAINGWVAARTHDRIQDLLLPADVTPATRIVLVNALYFYGSWLTLFDATLTRPAVFHTLAGSDVEVPTMRQSMSREYKATASLEVLKLPYVQGKLWMTLVLPKAGEFAATRTQISGPWLSDITSGMTATDVTLSLPKFKLETAQLKLKDPLTDMGMGIAFSGQADFSGITPAPLSIGEVIQKAFIGVDEAGTEAAAATAVTMPGANPTPTPFVVDRPFLFFVQDATGLVLFSGQVVDPTQ